ncbi:hypothetical protein HU200_058798 [Digitaria exilis]|uniref:Protein kinase domain-containing protein n=1 Tax=Digitaria exilis TaxID=1010633 RepID=A0A835AD90_9POAL|nr:hypothetical protein HU200_058798 [Digitaria exilis]
MAIVLASLLTLPAYSLGATRYLHNESTSDLQALLCFKLHVSNPAGLLASWRNDSNQFCGWFGVTCNKKHPSRVIALDFESVELHGQIPPCIVNLTLLRRIHWPNNQLTGQIPDELGRLNSLQYLNLSLNNLSGVIPNTLSSCFRLQTIDLSTLAYLGVGMNSLTGELPYSIGNTLPNIQNLIMQENQFRGQIPTSLTNATNLQVLNIRYNALHGIVPHFGTLSNLIELNLGMNQLEAGDWSFLSSLANCTQLVRLYLDGNILQGILPSSIAGLSKSLEQLFLAANKISGTIPQEIGHLSNLMLLRMEQNLLTGNLPSSLGNLQNLYLLSLSQNQLSGQFPLSVRENNLSGSIPGALGRCKNLETLNLSYNSFYGSIPIEIFTLSSLSEGLDLSHNQLSGNIPPEISGLINLGTLIISNNKLSGKIPSTLGECVHLESLNMEANLLDGTIPESFANLRGIIMMDLSQNNLSGQIPEFIENFDDIKLLNLSFNDLEGQVPTGGIFQNASEVFVQVFKLDQLGAPRSFLAECKALRNTRHRNLVRVISACSTFDPSTSLMGPRGSIGYIAPEYGFGCKLSTEGDVYSYGIIILEMMTRRRPTDEMFTNGLDLHKYVAKACITLSFDDGGVANDFDHENLSTAGAKDCIMRLIKLGLSCSLETPKDRPTMQEVYDEVITIKEAFAALSG